MPLVMRMISLWAGSAALTKTVAGPLPAEYVNPNRARRFVPSSRRRSVTSSTVAPEWRSDSAVDIQSGVISFQLLGTCNESVATDGSLLHDELSPRLRHDTYRKSNHVTP